MANLTMPLVHLNGTSKAELIGQYMEAHTAMIRALRVLQSAAPNGRDYYPLGDGAWLQARAEHDARVQKIIDVDEEIMAIWESLHEQKGGRQ